MKQKEYIGFGSIQHIASVLKEFSARKIFLVTGRDSYSNSGAQKHLTKLLYGYETSRFCDFSCNPKIKDIEGGIEFFRSKQYDMVIAVGGGSVIDTAKLINFFAESKLSPSDYFKDIKYNNRKLKPLVAIPTTAGSGSDATSFAVLYIDKKKHSVEHKSLLPHVAIVDPDLTMSLPKYLTATSGLDALSQAIESYWSANSNDESKSFARASIKLIMTNIVKAVNNPDTSSRLAMAKASHLSGKAINITKTTAPHAISYPITSYFGISHGHAVALTLSSLLVFNANVTDEDVLDKRGARYVRETIVEICKFLGASSVDDAREKIDGLIREISLQTRLSMLGLRKKEDVEIIVANGFAPDRVKNNPRILMPQALRVILERIY